MLHISLNLEVRW